MLRIDFSIAADAQSALEESGKRSSTAFAILIVIEKEMLKLLAPPVTSSGGGLEDDLKATRKLLETKNPSGAYVIVRTSPSSQYVVIYVDNAASAKDRMLFSTGTSRVVGATPHAQKRTIQISSVSELLPSLFEAESKKIREDLMTESERNQAAIARMEVAPQPVALPGVAIKMTAEADEMLSQFAKGTVEVVTFKIVSEQLQLDTTVRKLNGDLENVKDVLPEAEPRFVLVRYPSPKTSRAEYVMVYVCPPSCSPKVKIQYASSAAAFREQASRHEIKFAQKVETDTRETLVEDVKSAFVPFNAGGASAASQHDRPRPPVAGAAKGHRMLI
ncbi:putative G-actin binding protein [Leptomonas pyrrhocoris]|uniref:Putative G-actin binding protein n=1 Tax=Leptomonas pyrrhocoris TaxID=157538 RepID=A0A0N0VG41_LEPPY|nr:putative G-actin binding protein [Leptomonas pyrrhocoris]KPA82278.1 putative G-actin binding protein [Leptomonas pyrrhocoris]|eukprot:XP_015660717.1 putative G-actin binding protein [Leptomonas pyrrhocoris]